MWDVPEESHLEKQRYGQRAIGDAVSENGMDMPGGLELVLRDGRRLRISQGVEEQILRAVLDNQSTAA